MTELKILETKRTILSTRPNTLTPKHFVFNDELPPFAFFFSMLSTLRKAVPKFLSTVSHYTTTSHSISPLTKPQLKTLVLNQYSSASSKFTRLLRNVVAFPPFLLTACCNLLPENQARLPDSAHPCSDGLLDLLTPVSAHFSVAELAAELVENKFDVEGCCVTMVPSRRKGEKLILPNLKLKVVIEAIRMVLELIYDDRFVTFVYGGRNGLGRHTAIRYLKNSVENPNWWFNVRFVSKRFGSDNVDKLCSILEQKINDEFFIHLIRRLFECNIVDIELGGTSLGRGLPQECGFCSILMNIYFDSFDKEVQEMRLKMDKENVRVDLGEASNGAFYKRIRLFAVRYLDEILIVTSGSKLLTMDLKSSIFKILEGKLGLKVDRNTSDIHSAVSEKIDFLGMELQAVLPSILRPPMSEKAIRARKKYLRQKEVRLLELKNARERNRKKLGLKIFRHVFKKLKQSNGFKFEFNIENEVREIFRTWADEVVQEFLGSLEERENWYRQLTKGDFLSLRHIRDQLPRDVVDSYDKFQEQVDIHLNPAKLRSALEEEKRRVEEEEEHKYAQRTVEDLTKLCMKVSAPIELVRKAVKMAGFTNNMGRPRPIKLLIALEDADIIKWYAGVGRRWLEYFCCCHNFTMVKTVVTYHLRFSCILTLAEKHESTKREAIRHYSKDLKVFDASGTEEVNFPSEREVKMMGDKNLSDPKPVDGALSLAMIRLAYGDSTHRCVAHFCQRSDTVLYRIRLLQNRLNVNPSDPKNWVAGMGAIHESLNRKCLPLCPDHINDLFMGRVTLQNIDCTSFVDTD